MNLWRLQPLLGASLRRHKLRTLLTVASVLIAYLLFGLLSALRHSLSGNIDVAGADRLMVMHKMSFIIPLPRSYVPQVASVPGVQAVSIQHWLGGYVGDERNIITAMVVDPETVAEVYPELLVPPDEMRNWLADPTSVLVGESLAKANGWKVGDQVPLRSNIYRRTDGSNSWPVRVAAIFHRTDGGDTASLLLHYRYFNESAAYGRDTVGIIVVRVRDRRQMSDVAHRIDARFANSPYETKTSDERAFVQGFINQFGNIGKLVTGIAAAVFFTLLLVTANTMARSVRERTAELAVLKTLGFQGDHVIALVLAESLLIVLLGALAGLSLAWLMAEGISHRFQQYFPLFKVTASAWTWSLLIALLLGLLSAAAPAWQAWRLKIVDALQRA